MSLSKSDRCQNLWYYLMLNVQIGQVKFLRRMQKPPRPKLAQFLKSQKLNPMRYKSKVYTVSPRHYAPAKWRSFSEEVESYNAHAQPLSWAPFSAKSQNKWFCITSILEPILWKIDAECVRCVWSVFCDVRWLVKIDGNSLQSICGSMIASLSVVFYQQWYALSIEEPLFSSKAAQKFYEFDVQMVWYVPAIEYFENLPSNHDPFKTSIIKNFFSKYNKWLQSFSPQKICSKKLNSTSLPNINIKLR